MAQLGTVGVLFLLFFVGMEISLPQLVSSWKVPVVGTLLQILISVGCIWVCGLLLDWSISRIVVLGFVISLSSTAVIAKVLQERNQLDSELGRDVLGVLLVQEK